MFCKRMAAITSKARDKLEELREAHRAESERLLGVFGDVLAGVRETLGPTETGQGSTTGEEVDAGGEQAAPVEAEPIAVVAERTGRMLLKTLHEAGGVAGLSAAHEEVSAHHGNNYTPLMERYYRSHRAALFAMLEVLELEPASTDRAVTDAVAVLRANRGRIGECIPGHHDGKTINLSFASEAWRATLGDRRRPGKLRRRHLEVCVFAHLAAELGNGNIAVTGSQEYANLHAQLMSWQQCEPLVAGYCAQAGLPDTAARCVTAWKQQLTDLAEQVDAGYPDNADLIISDGRPVLKRRAGAGPPRLRPGAGNRGAPAAAAAGAAGDLDPHRLPDRLGPPLRPRLRVGPQTARRPRPLRGHHVLLRHLPGPGRAGPPHAQTGHRPRAGPGVSPALRP
jgi:hypothetical protein